MLATVSEVSLLSHSLHYWICLSQLSLLLSNKNLRLYLNHSVSASAEPKVSLRDFLNKEQIEQAELFVIYIEQDQWILIN